MADNATRIAEIDAILQAGARTVIVDGTTVTYDFESLRRERRDLMGSDDTQRSRRPVASSIYLGGF